MGMDASIACRTAGKVSRTIASLFPSYVKMSTEANIIMEQNKFYHIARIPKVIGVVDGTQIRIQSPGGNNAESYRNRNGYYSMNFLIVATADLKFMNVVERCPGSSHDATVFDHSDLKIRFALGHFPNCLLLASWFDDSDLMTVSVGLLRFDGLQVFDYIVVEPDR
ncbi:unnamed protein product [Acanthoscelides obtectus]|uniref:DDE Tnp4 domain-containing protein n=1 Tax=Acanthoscelides obtectus TaxID=200917 RepID=A0A9P0PYA3_ACAOB|nr:unnamed protein product [Acanthoscelides obtectus]CAK1680297.1 Putative nuclease HARBI1 [Acanthoscelides obtectus]